jgi:hypothetical protein
LNSISHCPPPAHLSVGPNLAKYFCQKSSLAQGGTEFDAAETDESSLVRSIADTDCSCEDGCTEYCVEGFESARPSIPANHKNEYNFRKYLYFCTLSIYEYKKVF